MSRIDDYLDALFDGFTGTGAEGRQLMLEAEDHLRSAAEDAARRGLGADDAELEAVSAFGPVELVAARVHRAQRRPWERFVAARSLAVLAGATALLVFGAALLLRGVGLAVLLAASPRRRAQCPGDVGLGWRGCSQNIAVMWQSLIWAAVLLVAAAVALLALRALNRAVVPVIGSRTIAVLGLAFLGLAAFLYGQPSSGQQPAIGVPTHVISSVLAAVAGLALVVTSTERGVRLRSHYRPLHCVVR